MTHKRTREHSLMNDIRKQENVLLCMTRVEHVNIMNTKLVDVKLNIVSRRVFWDKYSGLVTDD